MEYRAMSLLGQDLCIYFQGVKAVDGVSIELYPGKILGLIGPNGAGKTTLMNALSGFVPLNSGRLLFDEKIVNAWPPNRLAKRGLARTFQNVRLFRGLTVLENVEVAAVGVGLSRRTARHLARELLERLGLTHRASFRADALSFGDEQRVGIARALATRPRYLLLDEPAAGLNESETEALASLISTVRKIEGCGVLLIEHDMRIVLSLCDTIQVLDEGKTISIGSAKQVQSDPKVVTAYLGTRQFRASAGLTQLKHSDYQAG